jgi:hypothetical protein
MNVVIELDVSEYSEEWADDLKNRGVTTKLVNEHGPGGGHPVYSFTGELIPVVTYLWEYANEELDDFQMFVKGLEPENFNHVPS